MTTSTTPENKSEAPSDELSPQTLMVPTPTSYTEHVPKFLEEEDEENDMPMLIFAWIDNNAVIFLQRWEAGNEQVSQLYPSFNRPKSLLDLYALLLE